MDEHQLDGRAPERDRGRRTSRAPGPPLTSQAFNPLIFLRDPNASAEGANLCTLLALSGRNSISLWVTSQSKPLVVLEDVFDRDVLDMSWCGRSRPICSH